MAITLHLFCYYRMLGLDLVVRDEQGNILNPDDTSVVELYKQVCPYLDVISIQTIISKSNMDHNFLKHLKTVSLMVYLSPPLTLH